MQLCDAFDIPVLFLCDTPGIMVGPEVEKTALVRHCSRLFVIGANLDVPFFTIVLRKAYGLGAQAMAGGSFQRRHVHRLLADRRVRRHGARGRGEARLPQGARGDERPGERRALFDKMVAAAYERGKALSTATYFELDDVIDPADSRRWIATALLGAPPRPRKRTRSGRTSILGDDRERGPPVSFILLPRHTGEGREGGASKMISPEKRS